MNKQNNQKVRRGQIITTFGPGALYNLEHGSFIGMGLQDWPSKEAIYEERLAKRLNFHYFIQPPSGEDYPKGLPYRRFPRWLFCPQCRLLQPYEKWSASDTRR